MIDRINLLPRSYVARHEVSARRVGLVVVPVVLICFLLGIYLYYDFKVGQLEKELVLTRQTEQRLKSEFVKVNEQILTMENLKRDTADLQHSLEVLNSLSRRQVLWSRILRNMTVLVPGDVWLHSLNASDGNSSHPGSSRIALTGYAISNAALANFIAAIESSNFFHGTSLSYVRSAQWNEKDIYQFEIATEFTTG